MVMVALVKAAFEICHACNIDYGIVVGRRSVAEIFRSLCFDEIKGPIRISEAKTSLLWVFAIPTLEWESRLRTKGHAYYEFLAQTQHSDIDIDYQLVFEAFGVA